MKTNTVAIITRTRDRPLFLPRARDSVSRQVFRDFVWVVVNDAGDPAPVDREIARARDQGIDCIAVHRERSQGMEAASNAGIGAVDSTYVVIHDDDDSWHPAFLQKTAAHLDANSTLAGVVARSGNVYERVSRDRILETGREPVNRWLHAVCLADLAVCNLYPPISFLFRRSACDAVKGFDEALPVLGDWDFNLRVLLHGDIGVLPEVLAYHHIRPGIRSGEDQQGNSEVADAGRHQFFDVAYRNRKFREDLATGAPGLGHILTAARMHSLPYITLVKLRAAPHNAFSRLSSRLKNLLGR